MQQLSQWILTHSVLKGKLLQLLLLQLLLLLLHRLSQQLSQSMLIYILIDGVD